MSNKTIFQKIIDKEIPANIEYEDDNCIIIHDINPQAPVHLLCIPKKTIPRLSEIDPSTDSPLLGSLLAKVHMIVHQLKIDKGFRVVINNGISSGESVPHLHVHVLAGRAMKWPPG